MSAKSVDIATMLDELNLPLAAARWIELRDGPEMADYTPGQLFREVLEPQYLETMNNRYKTNLRLSRLIDKGALTENLVTSSKRRYNDVVVQQLLSFRFAEERLNVGIYGITEAGKSYFLSAFCKYLSRPSTREADAPTPMSRRKSRFAGQTAQRSEVLYGRHRRF